MSGGQIVRLILTGSWFEFNITRHLSPEHIRLKICGETLDRETRITVGNVSIMLVI